MSPTAAPRDLVDAFYKAFAQKDGRAMSDAYAPGASFSDPVFVGLKDGEPGAMWRMLTRSKELRITHEIVSETGDTVVARWVATYPFSATGRTVENHVTSTIRFSDGKIVAQTDVFDLSKWVTQAFGPVAHVPFAKTLLAAMTRKKARAQLQAFIAKGN